MEQFTDLFNRLQAVINVVGDDVNFPQIVVVGSQSDGKSSVLESIVTKGFLPRGAGVVTRTPVILQLTNARSYDQSLPSNGFKEYAELSYPDPENSNVQTEPEVIDDFSQIASRIIYATERLAGKQKNIVDKPITVKLFSAHVPDLTLVDLPGLIENRSGDQPDDIKEQVEKLVRSYVQNPNAIILAVHPATSDLANSKSLNIARQVDSNGKRTVCVITKLDLADNGEDKSDLLTGVEIGHHHAKVLRTIGVINRSQTDAGKPGFSPADQLQKEERWFKTNYAKIADQHGTKSLSDFLALIFREHIRKCLPALKARVNEMLSESFTQLELLGEDMHTKLTESELSDPSMLANPGYILIVGVIDQFVNYFKGAITGDTDQGNTAVKGGACIEELFNETYWNALSAIKPLDNVDQQQTWTQIRNAWGTERQMFLTIRPFRILVQSEMSRMETESVRCVTLAHQELLSIRNSAGEHIGSVKEQFPKLFDRISDTVAQFMEIHLVETKEMVKHAVRMQLDYLNVKHPDFEKPQTDAMKRFHEVTGLVEESLHNDGSTTVHAGINGPSRIAPIPPTRPPKPPHNAYGVSVNTSGGTTFAPQENGVSGVTGLWSAADSNIPVVPQTSGKGVRGLTKREKLECDITEQLVRDYFEVILRIVRDSVPKVIHRFLINAVKDGLLQELLTKIAASREIYAPLLSESEIMATKRRTYSEKLQLFRNAADIIRELELT